MKIKDVKKRIKMAIDKVNKDIETSTNQSDFFARGLSREGFRGGYYQALIDILQVINDIEPQTEYWKPIEKNTK